MLGQRQNMAAKLGLAPGSTWTVTVDHEFFVTRIKLLSTTGAITANTDKIKIEAEGEILWSGQAVPVTLVFDKSAVGGVAAADIQYVPYYLTFDRPLRLSKDYPLKITNDAGSTLTFNVAIEGP